MTCLVNEKGTFHYKRAFYMLFKSMCGGGGGGGRNMPLARTVPTPVNGSFVDFLRFRCNESNEF